MARRKPEQTGVYIDVKNYIKPFHNDQEKILEKLHWICHLAAEHGQIVQQRAYADFTSGDVPSWVPRVFSALNIECIFTPCYSGGEKDMDDQMMARDITTLPFLHPDITTVFVVTGDGHIVPALSFYRSTGRRAMVISTNGTSEVLKNYANDGFWQVEISTDEKSDADELSELLVKLVHTQEYSKDGLISALHRQIDRPRANIEKEIASYLKQGTLRYEQTVRNGHPVKILRLNADAIPN